MTNNARSIVLASPAYSTQTAGSGRGVWRACRDMSGVTVTQRGGSLLANNFNQLWCDALNMVHRGERVDYFAMLHADISPADFWLDELIAELDATGLDLLSVAVPIKDMRGLTSCAIASNSPWRPDRRISTRELASLPPTFTSVDVGGDLLVNSGCWVCRFDMEWARNIHFTINDRIVFDTYSNQYLAECEPEDWFISRRCHEMGLKIGATRKIPVVHTGTMEFSNQNIWGGSHDTFKGQQSSFIKDLFPSDVRGWLHHDEGHLLAKYAEGKRVLEIGSFCGRSTICMARKAKCVVCIDTWDGRATEHEGENTLDEFHANIARYGLSEKVFPLREGEEIGNDYDLVFIDADHSKEAVQADIQKALSVLTDGGLIAFHDYTSPEDPGVTEAVNEFLASGAEIVEQSQTLAVVRPPVLVPN